MSAPKDGRVRFSGEQMYEILQNSKTNSILKKCLTPEIVKHAKGKKTRWGGNLERCINSGVECLDSKVGCHACDPDAHELFAELLDPVIKMYHKVNGEIRHPKPDFGDVENFSCDLDPSGKYIISTRARVGRSVAGFPYAIVMGDEDRYKIEAMAKNAYSTLPADLAGTYYPLCEMSKEFEQQLIREHYLFKTDDPFHEAASANRNWPFGRGIFLSTDTKHRFVSWCNEADHLRFISMQNGGNLGQVYRRLVRAVNHFNTTMEFGHSDKYGYLTYCPSNLGTTLRASVHMKIPLLSVQPNFKEICESLGIQARGVSGEHTKSVGGVFDLSNKRRLGLTEIQAVTEMVRGVTHIMGLEQQLERVKDNFSHWGREIKTTARESYELLQRSDTKQILKTCLTPEVIAACDGKVTKWGGTLERCINSGVENLDSKMGCHASDPEAHEMFACLLDPVIKIYHKVDGEIKHPAADFGDLNNLPIKAIPHPNVISTRVRVGRSVAGYPYCPTLTYKQRMEIQEMAFAGYKSLPDDLAGVYYPLTGLSDEKRLELIRDHYLFKTDDKFHVSAGAHPDWPDGRGIFVGDSDKKVVSWCNEADHLRFISMQMGGDLPEVYRRLMRFVGHMNNQFDGGFGHSPKYGYLTYCPSNLGTTLRASVHAAIPNLSARLDFREICAGYNIQARGVYGEHTDSVGGVYDLSNKRRLGLTEIEAMIEMYKGVTALLDLDASLGAQAAGGVKGQVKM